MSRLLTSRDAALRTLLAVAVAVVAGCGGDTPSAQPPTQSPAATSAPSAAPTQATSQTMLTAQEVCAKVQVSAAQQATGDPWNRSEAVGTPVSCDFTDAGDDRLSIASTTYPSKQIADVSWRAGFPGNPQAVQGLGRQAVFLTVPGLSGGTQGQLYVRTTDTGQYNIRLTSAKDGSGGAALLDACRKVAQLLLSQ
jgi:hypothetical protein